MASIWDKLASDDEQRWSRLSLTFGITWTAVGAIGTVIVLAIGRPDKIFGGIIMMLTGLLILGPALIARGRRRRRH